MNKAFYCKAFIEYSNNKYGIYKDIEEYNANKKRKILITFDDMIANMLNIKKLNPIVTELFLIGRKPNIYLVFIAKSYFPLNLIRLNSMPYFVLKVPSKSFHKLCLIIYQILAFKILWKIIIKIFMKNVPINHILFRLLILLLHQIILHESESLEKNINVNHDN